MKTIIVVLIAAVMTGCFPERYSPGPTGDVVRGENPGYWKLASYRKKGKLVDPEKASGKALLEVRYIITKRDSVEEPLYQEGFPHYLFSFFNVSMQKTDSAKAVLSDARFDRKYKRSEYWYQINKDSGFAAYLDVELGKETIIHKVELSNVMKSATYKPELDSLRYIYEQTAKFK
ncbi:hypothetical protein [Dyadobacter sp. CY343]|uniref:hypothetical protein n=1 Tax=Dyadobacter sp. CY343 TaxID=2907299 RepID=UPI001F248895|nr:hypothetical protein [Dyadobacter sp. CY343]MCE7060534.1 hypothetical protein [Dyadobacter sp. CY343]